MLWWRDNNLVRAALPHAEQLATFAIRLRKLVSP
jgi:hypothetical protein